MPSDTGRPLTYIDLGAAAWMDKLLHIQGLWKWTQSMQVSRRVQGNFKQVVDAWASLMD